jgi:hypothetical protein
MQQRFIHWLLNTPTHLTNEEALKEAETIVKEELLEDTDSCIKSEMMVMLMAYWHDCCNSDSLFAARFWDWRKSAKTTKES